MHLEYLLALLNKGCRLDLYTSPRQIGGKYKVRHLWTATYNNTIYKSPFEGFETAKESLTDLLNKIY